MVEIETTEKNARLDFMSKELYVKFGSYAITIEIVTNCSNPALQTFEFE